MTKISFRLEHDSIRHAIEELENYRKGLEAKCEILCDELKDEGIKIAQRDINSSPLGNTITLRSEINKEKMGCQALLIASGTITQTGEYPPFNTLLAVEFGAGIHYNKEEQNPRSADFNMGIGTFPVLPGHVSHAFDDKGWYYYGNDEKWHHSSGVKATMPMYHASQHIEEILRQKAKEVFGSERG